MKKIFSFLILFVAALPLLFGQTADGVCVEDSVRATDSVRPVEKYDTIRVLAIGNSFSVNAVENHLYQLGRQAHTVFIIGNLYIGSCSLRMHAQNIRTRACKYSYRTIRDGHRSVHENTSLQHALQDEPWDIISMQQVSNTCGMIRSYEPWLTELTDSVRHYMKPGARLVWHMTWAYQMGATHPAFKDYNYSQQQMYDAIVKTVKELLDTHDFWRLIPSGTMVQNCRATATFGDTMSKDGYHLLGPGQYAAACTWLEVLTGRSCVGNAYRPKWLSAHQQRILQQCAHNAVLHPYEVTPIDAPRRGHQVPQSPLLPQSERMNTDSVPSKK